MTNAAYLQQTLATIIAKGVATTVPLLSNDIDKQIAREQQISSDLRKCLNASPRRGLKTDLSRETHGAVTANQVYQFLRLGKGGRRTIALIEQAAEQLNLWPAKE